MSISSLEIVCSICLLHHFLVLLSVHSLDYSFAHQFIYFIYLFIYFKVAFILGLLKAKDDAVLYLLVVNLLGKM